jgi:dihydrofolate reductase
MARLSYTTICSLDGYMADEHGDFSWSRPDEDVHQFINDLERPIGTQLVGRRMYEIMRVWEHPEEFGDEPVILDYAAIWQASEKIVYSSTLTEVTTARTRIVREFDSDEVRRRKATADNPISISGPTLAAHALRAGLVDDLHMFIVPWVIGGGLPVLPDGLRLALELRDEHRFGNGTVYLRYAVRD